MRWFTQPQIERMTVPVIRRIRSRIRSGDLDGALALCEELKHERIILHDFLAEAATALATWTSRELGEDSLYDAFLFVFEQSAVRQVYNLIATGGPRHVEAAMLARNCWLAHSCSGAGEHGAEFAILEDDHRFTFVLDPCGSGGRIWRKGLYEPQGKFALTARAHPWSYGRPGFPAYCTHCAVLNELLPYLHLGYSTWPVEPPLDAGEPCRWHVYKDRFGVPAVFYERFGLAAPVGKGRPARRRARSFSDEQLEEMATPTPVRLRRMLEEGDRAGALRVCGERGGEFLFLHNLYVSALACTMDYIGRKTGEDGLGGALEYVYLTCAARQVAGPMEMMTRRDALSFIVGNLFLAGTSGGVGHPPSHVGVTEDEQEVTVRLDPCPSGGKLLMRGAYGEPGALSRARERAEDAALSLAVKAHPPRFVLDRAVFPMVDYITETRKPRGLNRLRSAHHWTGEIKGLPACCALCTSMLALSGCDWLEVYPPAGSGGTCTWRATK